MERFDLPGANGADLQRASFHLGRNPGPSRRLASALARRGVGYGDTVAAMLWNTPEMFECQFGVPMCGAVLNTLNVRLDAPTIAFMFDHSEAKALITDREHAGTIDAALALCRARPLIVDVDDPGYPGEGARLGEVDYETFLASGDPDYVAAAPKDEWDAIALNYTSGTTGDPKGVVYHHRGAYLAALGAILAGAIPRHAVFLWTAPMFHCNGWCFPWAMAALAGTGVCLRKIEPTTILGLIREHRITHFGAAPIVHNQLLNAPDALWDGIHHKLTAYIAGAAAFGVGMVGWGLYATKLMSSASTSRSISLDRSTPAWLDVPARASIGGEPDHRD